MTKKDRLLSLALAAVAGASVFLTYYQTILNNKLGAAVCGDEVPSFLGTFDFSTAPPLLFYAYIPIVIASALFGTYVLRQRNKSLRTKLLLSVLAFFVLWVVNVLVQWVASYHVVLLFAWQLTALFEVGLYASAAYFGYVFIYKKDLPFWGKAALTAVVAAVLGAIPTALNVASYDLKNCEGIVGPLWSVIYGALEPLTIVALLAMGAVAFRKEKDSVHRREIAVFSAGFAFFLTTFTLSNIFGEISGDYGFNLWGPVGMVVFFAMLGYMVVKFQTFHVKLIATEALVWSLALLIGSQFLTISSRMDFILNGITFAIAIVFGQMLIRTVRVEIEQKNELAELLQQRESLEHLVTHKVKGAFTRTKFIFAEALGGTFGPLSEKMREMAEQGLEFSEDGITSSEQVLNAANLKKGTIKYEMKPLDFKELALNAIAQKRGPAEKKGLAMASDVADGDYPLLGDAFWLQEVAYNLVDNAVKYTAAGTITVGLHARDGKLLFSVKDTGAGITDEDKKVLFTEGGRGKESTKMNADSTGYGLFTIKLVVEGHGGRAWVESAVGKGSTFFAELPLA